MKLKLIFAISISILFLSSCALKISENEHSSNDSNLISENLTWKYSFYENTYYEKSLINYMNKYNNNGVFYGKFTSSSLTLSFFCNYNSNNNYSLNQCFDNDSGHIIGYINSAGNDKVIIYFDFLNKFINLYSYL